MRRLLFGLAIVIISGRVQAQQSDVQQDRTLAKMNAEIKCQYKMQMAGVQTVYTNDPLFVACVKKESALSFQTFRNGEAQQQQRAAAAQAKLKQQYLPGQ
jgi:hypothetical protein